MKSPLVVLLAVLTLGCRPTSATPAPPTPSVPRTNQVTTPTPAASPTASPTAAPTPPPLEDFEGVVAWGVGLVDLATPP